MTVKVLFFGATADIVRKRYLEIDIENGESVETLFNRLLAANRSLSKHDLRFSINQNYATGQEILVDGDEVAIFTAVSGG